MKKIKKFFKALLNVFRVIVISIIFFSLLTAYLKLDSKVIFIYSLALIHLVVFGIGFILANKFFKKKGMIRDYLVFTYKFAVTGLILHSLNLALNVFAINILAFFDFVLATSSIFCTSVMLQRISFFNLV